jgi:hypothetical protein
VGAPQRPRPRRELAAVSRRHDAAGTQPRHLLGEIRIVRLDGAGQARRESGAGEPADRPAALGFQQVDEHQLDVIDHLGRVRRAQRQHVLEAVAVDLESVRQVFDGAPNRAGRASPALGPAFGVDPPRVFQGRVDPRALQPDAVPAFHPCAPPLELARTPWRPLSRDPGVDLALHGGDGPRNDALGVELGPFLREAALRDAQRGRPADAGGVFEAHGHRGRHDVSGERKHGPSAVGTLGQVGPVVGFDRGAQRS